MLQEFCWSECIEGNTLKGVGHSECVKRMYIKVSVLE